MKKIIVFCLIALFPSLTYAVMPMGFGDGNYFDPEFSTESPRYACLPDGNCYDNKTKEMTTKLDLFDYSEPTTNQESFPIINPVNRQPLIVFPTPSVTPTPLNLMPTPTPTPSPTPTPVIPFAGKPYVYIEQRKINPDTENEFTAITLGVELNPIFDEALKDLNLSLNNKYRIKCNAPSYSEEVYLGHIRRITGTNTAIADVQGRTSDGNTFGHYSCEFHLQQPEGTYISEPIQFDLSKDPS